MNKKILHITWNMGIGGAQRAIYQLIRAQRQKGIPADLLVATAASFYGEKTKETGAVVFELGQKFGMDFSIKSKFRNIIENYDILHFQTVSPLLMYLSSTQNKVKCYYTHRGGIRRYSFKKKLLYKISGYLIKKMCTGISGNTRNAALSASLLFNIPLDKICVTYNGIDFSLLEPKRNKAKILNELKEERNNNTIRIGTSANIQNWKRLDYLLIAVSNLRDISLHCYIIGDGPAKSSLEKLGKDLGIQNRVTFTGKKEYIGDYLQILDIFALPSTISESFGNSAVEAIGMGIPTIVMQDGGGLIEHIGEQGGFVAKDIGDMAAIIRKLSGSKELRMRVGEKGKKFVREKYSIENMLKSYEAFYANDEKGTPCKRK
jgi:glycosyltransferase involved in cell wall biosynthesis